MEKHSVKDGPPARGLPAPLPFRILLAEDDEQMRWSLEQIFKAHGFDVMAVSTGEQLLEHLAASMLLEHKRPEPDLIVSDVRMPGFNGLSILEGLRLAGWLTPFVLITAYGDSAIRQKALSAGATAFFEKPIDPAQLEEVLHAAERLRASNPVERRAVLAIEEGIKLLDAVRVFREEEVGELVVLRRTFDAWVAMGIIRRDRVAEQVLALPYDALCDLSAACISEPIRADRSESDQLLHRLESGQVPRVVALLRCPDRPSLFAEVRRVEPVESRG